MRKTLFLFGAMLTTMATFTSCSKEDSVKPTKNYYGVEPASNGTPKEAYYAFFGGVLAIVFVVVWLLKKMNSKK